MNTRTTITIDEDLLFEIKKKALMERKTIKEVINENLTRMINGGCNYKITMKKKQNIMSFWGILGKGKSGTAYLKEVRYSSKERERDKYLEKLWKKS